MNVVKVAHSALKGDARSFCEGQASTNWTHTGGATED